MAGQPANACHAGDAHQGAAAAPRHALREGVKGGRQPQVVGGEGAGHDVQVFPHGGVHAHADACVGNHHIGQALARDAFGACCHDAVHHSHVCTINFVATGAYLVGVSP